MARFMDSSFAVVAPYPSRSPSPREYARVSKVVLDTNILLRLANPAVAEHEVCRTAVTRVVDAGSTLATAPQIAQFDLLIETREAFDMWRALVSDTKIQGKRAHDARIVAVMLSSGVTELVTLNTAAKPRRCGGFGLGYRYGTPACKARPHHLRSE